MARRSVFSGRGRVRRGDQANEPTPRGSAKAGTEDGGVTSGPELVLTGETAEPKPAPAAKK
jgi:hypothetical protein